MSINECSKADNGTIAGTNIGKDEGVALQNQANWPGFVCKDSSTGDYFVLNGAVAASNRATSSVSPKKQSSDLKRDINNLIGEVSSLQLQIEKYKKELADSPDSQGFFHKPSTVFAMEMMGLAAGFGAVVPFLEDLRLASKLRNSQELIDRANRNIQQMGGCSALPKAAGSTGKALKWGAAGVAAGGLLAYDALSSGSAGGQTSSVPAQTIPAYSDNMSENDLQALYDKLITQQQALVKEKVELEKKIAAKPETKKTAMDKAAENPVFKAGAVFGIFGLGVPAIRDLYFKSSFHQNVLKAEEALNLEAEALAAQAMGAGQCKVEAVTAAEPVTVSSTQTSNVTQSQMSLVEDGATMCSAYPSLFPGLTDGALYAYDTGYSTQLVRAPFFQQAATPPPVNVSEADLQTFTEADYQPYLQYLGANVSSHSLTRVPEGLQFFFETPETSFAHETPVMEIQNQIPDLVASAYSNVAPADVIKADVTQISGIYAEPYSLWNLNSMQWALKSYMQGLETGVRPDVSKLVELAGENGVVNRYFETKEIQRSHQAGPDSQFTFEQAATSYVDVHQRIAYNTAHAAELQEESEYRAWKSAAAVTDARIDTFTRANVGTSWKITLGIATGQALYEIPVLAPAAETTTSWGGWQMAGAGI